MVSKTEMFLIMLLSHNNHIKNISQCCRILLGHQINPKERDVDGFTAADLAEYNGHFECARYLRSEERNVRFISYAGRREMTSVC